MRGAGRIVLVAPDDARRRQDAAFLEAEGFSVRCAADAAEGRAALSAAPADALIERDAGGGLVTRATPEGAVTSHAADDRWRDPCATLRLAAHRAIAAGLHAEAVRARVDALGAAQGAIDADTDELWDRREALEQRAARGRKLAQLVAHDLKNHLSVVKTNVEYALSEVREGAPCCAPLDEAAVIVEDAFRLVAAFVAAAARAA